MQVDMDGEINDLQRMDRLMSYLEGRNRLSELVPKKGLYQIVCELKESALAPPFEIRKVK